MRVLTVVMAVAVIGLASAAYAAPLDLKQVGADAKWLVHVDVDAIRASSVVQKAWPKIMEMHKEAEKRIDHLRDCTGMDLRKDMHGVTMWGTEIGKHKGIAIVNAKVDQKLLLEKAEKAPDHKVVKYEGLDIHTWTMKKGEHSHTAAGAFFKPDVIVFASSADELKTALNVLAGKSPSVGTDSPLQGRIFPGTTVLMRATGLADAKLPEKCPLANKAKSVRIAMGENEGKSFFRARVEMTNDEVAGQVAAIIQGGRAMATLHCQKDEQAKKLIDAVTVKTEGPKLTISWQASADDVWTMMEKHGKEMAAKHAKRHAEMKAGQEKAADQKSCEKKPDEKKADAKNPDEKKSGEKKPKEKKPGDKKRGQKKSDEKSSAEQ